MSERKAGWYWVRLDEASPDVLRNWEPCLWIDGEWDDEDGYDWDEYGEVGQRIPTPDEIEDMVIMPRSVYEFLLDQKREFKAREWNPERTEFINGMERRIPEPPDPPPPRSPTGYSKIPRDPQRSQRFK